MQKTNLDKAKFFQIFKHGIFPCFFYFSFFCLLTYPLVLKFTTHFFTDEGDGLQNIWNLWWVNLVVRNPDLYPTIWWTNLLHWPYGTTLLGHTLNPFNGYLNVILRQFFSPNVAFNCIILFSFVAGGLTTYWLSYLLTKSFWGSILAGFIFTFSNYHFMHAQGHLQLVALEWIPLFLMLWYLLVVRPSTLTGLGAAIALWLVLLCDYYYFFYCFLSAIVIVLWYALSKKDVFFLFRKEYGIPLITFIIVLTPLVSPILFPLFIDNAHDPFIGSHDPISFSLDLLSLVIPGGHWLFNQWTKSFWSNLPGNVNESSVFLSIPVYAMIVYAWSKHKQEDKDTIQQLALWSFIFVFFILLALGPALQVDGFFIWGKAMPYTLLGWIFPFLSLSGVPVRMMVIVILSASILSAFGFKELFRHLPHRLPFLLLLLGLLLFQSIPSPLPTTHINTPGYITALMKLPDSGGILDLATPGQSLSLYYQTIHGKPIAFGYVSRLPTSVVNADELLSQTIEAKDYARLWDTYHIRYIVTPLTLQARNDQPFIKLAIIYQDQSAKIYRLGCTCEGRDISIR